MENVGLYQDIAKRTDGDIYIGVVGPVRTGKSTFIKKFMDLLVIPNIDNEYKKDKDSYLFGLDGIKKELINKLDSENNFSNDLDDENVSKNIK